MAEQGSFAVGPVEGPVPTRVEEPLLRAGIALDRLKREVICRGRRAQLTKREFQVLCVLMEAEGRILNSTAIQRQAFGQGAHPHSQQVPTIVARLRRRLGDPHLIETIVGEGYRMVSAAELNR